MSPTIAQDRVCHDEEQAEFFRTQGYLIVRNLFRPDEVADMAGQADRLLAADLIFPDNMRCRWREDIDTGEQVFDLFEPVLDVAPDLARYVNAPNLLAVLETVMGGPVCHMREKMIYKPPRATGVKLHQDWHSWERQPESFTTVAIAIDPHDEETGCVQVYPGMQDKWLGPPDTWYFMEDEQVAGVEPVSLLLEPGDVAIFGPLIPHRSAPNQSRTRWRRGFFPAYNLASDGGQRREEAYKNYVAYRLAHRHEKGQPNLTFR